MKKFFFILGPLVVAGLATGLFLFLPESKQRPVSASAPESVVESPVPIPSLETPSRTPHKKTVDLALVKDKSSSPRRKKRSRAPTSLAKELDVPSQDTTLSASENVLDPVKEPDVPYSEPVALATETPALVLSQEKEIADSKLSEQEDEVSSLPLEGVEQDLIFQPRVGYGVEYISLEQSGAFGGGEGGTDLTGGPTVGVQLKYGDWNFSAAYDQISVSLPVNSGGTVGEKKDFQVFSLTGGYKSFFIGGMARKAPLVRASTSLTWAEVTTIEAVSGLRAEKLFAGSRRSPFLLGVQLQGSIPLSVSANGGPALSKPSGFGVSVTGYAEKEFSAGAKWQLKFGLEASASYEKAKFEGSWSGASGTVKRTIQQYGSRAYLGLDF